MDADSCGFMSRADWYLRWPFIRDGIDGLVVLSEEDGSISRETWLELRDAMDSGLPCWFVTGTGDLAPAGVDPLPALPDRRPHRSALGACRGPARRLTPDGVAGTGLPPPGGSR